MTTTAYPHHHGDCIPLRDRHPVARRSVLGSGFRELVRRAARGPRSKTGIS